MNYGAHARVDYFGKLLRGEVHCGVPDGHEKKRFHSQVAKRLVYHSGADLFRT